MRALIAGWCASYPHARSVDVDYAEDTLAEVAKAYFGGLPVPPKVYRGAPFYAYLFALHAASHDLVLHLDSDMVFGGGSAAWMDEAVAVLDALPDVLACNPLPGPPTADGGLRSQVLEPVAMHSPAFRSTGLSARLFVADRRRLVDLAVDRPSRKQALGARVDGNPPVLPLEDVVSRKMERDGLFRLDFLGRGPGMWSIHPPYRSSLFYERLPSLIGDVERGEVPEGQRGFHDLEDCMLDWSDVRPSPFRRIETHSRLLLERVLGLAAGS